MPTRALKEGLGYSSVLRGLLSLHEADVCVYTRVCACVCRCSVLEARGLLDSPRAGIRGGCVLPDVHSREQIQVSVRAASALKPPSHLSSLWVPLVLLAHFPGQLCDQYLPGLWIWFHLFRGAIGPWYSQQLELSQLSLPGSVICHKVYPGVTLGSHIPGSVHPRHAS